MSIQLINLQKRYVAPDGSVMPVIDVPQFSIADGEQVALIGTSGSGKTTLLNLIAGILGPDSGQILFSPPGTPLRQVAESVPDSVVDYRSARVGATREGAVNLTALSEARRDVFRGENIGYIFQTHHLLPGFTALENVQLGMSFTGRKIDKNWAQHLLTEVGLGDRLHYKPAKLSVGQQQRVAVARALANRPRLVLADEPTGALDEVNAKQVMALIRSLCREVGAALLIVTHDLDIAGQFERVIDLKELNRAAQKVAVSV